MFRWWKKHTSDGLEKPDPTPIEVPMVAPLTIQQQLARFVGDKAIQARLMDKGIDTFEEASDFGPEEPLGDNFPGTPYQMQPMGEEEFDDTPVQTRVDELRAGHVAPQSQDRLKTAVNRVRDVQKARKGVDTPPPPSNASKVA